MRLHPTICCLALAGLFCVSAALPAKADQSATLFGPITLVGAEPDYLDLAAGGYAVLGNHERNQTFGGRAEFRFGDKLFDIGPAVGVVGDARGGFDTFVAAYSDISFGHFVVTPLVGVSSWFRGDQWDENLGGTFEFRLEMDAAYQFDGGSRLGLLWGHLSSAGINHVNPGENEFMLSYSVPLNFLK